MENYGLVSVIMPTYNCAPYIGETIRSVQSQTYENWEIIIVDDCSTDNTESIVKSINDKRIRYYKNSKNSGAAVSRNFALREAKGRWIAFLDSDDLWAPTKLEHQLRFMVENNYAFSYHNYSEIDEQSKSLGIVISGPKHISKFGMFNYCWPGCLTVMYNREVVGPLEIADIKKNNDYAMWLKVIEQAECYLLNENLASYRKRTGSISNHGYTALIKWHYRLFKKAENCNCIIASFNTIRNLIFGVYKKLRYKKRA
jgi:glycosyltransferase involved in cell wall biosynthesis